MQPVPLHALVDYVDTLTPEARRGISAVVFAQDQAEYTPLPALVFPDHRILTEWSLSEEERARLVAGETLRLWIWLFPVGCPACRHVQPARLQPLALEVTQE